MNRLELEREVERRRQVVGRSFEKEHSMDECIEWLYPFQQWLPGSRNCSETISQQTGALRMATKKGGYFERILFMPENGSRC